MARILLTAGPTRAAIDDVRFLSNASSGRMAAAIARAALAAGQPRLMLSTGFETGIGRRWLHHLAALQMRGPTPAAPGLASGWQPPGALFAADPWQVWEAAQPGGDRR